MHAWWVLTKTVLMYGVSNYTQPHDDTGNEVNASHCSYAAQQHSAQPEPCLSTADLFVCPIS